MIGLQYGAGMASRQQDQGPEIFKGPYMLFVFETPRAQTTTTCTCCSHQAYWSCLCVTSDYHRAVMNFGKASGHIAGEATCHSHDALE